MFVAGGVTGVMQASAPLDYQLHDSYFIVAHFHYVIVGGTVLGLLAGLHFYWPLMFNTMLDETLGKITFWLFLFGFNLTFFIQHFLGLLGMPRRVFTYGKDQGWDLFNLISSLGAIFMALAIAILLVNIVKTIAQNKAVGRDPWGDGRTLEWAIPQPVPFYNFKQTPLVRGLDTFWIEKQEGNKEGMTYAEPIGDIHMPNNSFIPFVMAFGLFVGAFGALYNGEKEWAVPVLILGLLISFLSMGARSLKDDLGYHIHKEDLMDKKGGKH